MSTGQILALTASLLAAASIVIGSRISLMPGGGGGYKQERLVKLLAFGAGVLFIAICLDFLPDAWNMAGDTWAPWGIVIGALLLWTFTQISDRLFAKSQARSAAPFTLATAAVLGISLSVHSFLEGTTLAVITQHINTASIEFVIAMLLHKLPEGVLWGLAIISAYPNNNSVNSRKLWYILLIPAACTFLGTGAGLIFLGVASSHAIAIISAILAGALIYICFSELFPSIREYAGVQGTNIWFVIGMIVMIIPIALASIWGTN